MKNKIKTRKSQLCVAWCNSKDCFDSYEQRLIGGQKLYWVWISHCKAREGLHNKVLRGKKS